MNTRLEWVLASLLHYGSWLASIVIGLGLAFSSMRAATIGIALFILLPTLRVLLMLLVFLRERDYRFTAIAALVLAIILLGFAVGMRTTTEPT
ncbi:MAG TPA: DUF1634 domain-containing protein [Bryobacteraceae bacterium]|nr:DUF1634 domain-containing protein [Bryobacteraceae bacterium]